MSRLLSVISAIVAMAAPLINWLIQKGNPDNKRLKKLIDYDEQIADLEREIDELSKKQRNEVKSDKKKDMAVDLGNLVNRLVFLRSEREKYLKRY